MTVFLCVAIELKNTQMARYFKDDSLIAYFVKFDSPNCKVKKEEEIEYAYREYVTWKTDGTIQSMYVFAHNEEEAKKIASEKRAKLIAERTGVV